MIPELLLIELADQFCSSFRFSLSLKKRTMTKMSLSKNFDFNMTLLSAN